MSRVAPQEPTLAGIRSADWEARKTAGEIVAAIEGSSKTLNLLAVITLVGFEKVVTFLVMLSILIVLHELGHFVVARRNGVRVNEFAVGFGPKLAGWTSPRTGTQYSLRALPIGGFCAMEGEDNRVSEAEQQREFLSGPAVSENNFQAKSPWRRLAIILAGPVANFLLCYLILLIAAFAFGVASDKANQPVVGEVVAGSPAAIAGIRPGDRIVAINNVPVANGRRLVDTIHGALGKKLDLVYVRNGVRMEVYVVPRAVPGPSREEFRLYRLLPGARLRARRSRSRRAGECR